MHHVVEQSNRSSCYASASAVGWDTAPSAEHAVDCDLWADPASADSAHDGCGDWLQAPTADECSAPSWGDAESRIPLSSEHTEINGIAGSLTKEIRLLLEECQLVDKADAAVAWAWDNGAASMEEIFDNADELSDALTLEPLARNRLIRACRARASGAS